MALTNSLVDQVLDRDRHRATHELHHLEGCRVCDPFMMCLAIPEVGWAEAARRFLCPAGFRVFVQVNLPGWSDMN